MPLSLNSRQNLSAFLSSMAQTKTEYLDLNQLSISVKTSLNASWDSDIFGSLRNGKRKAQANLEKSKAYEHAVQTQLVATIAERIKNIKFVPCITC